MKRVLLPLLLLSLVLAVACSEADSPATTSVTTASTGETQESASSPTYQAVVLGPGAEPLASADVAPSLFRSEPSIIEALKTTVPAEIAARIPGGRDHLIVAIYIAGAANSGEGVEVYAVMREAWYSLDRGTPVGPVGGAVYPVRLRLTKVGDAYRIDGVDKPKDGAGYLSSLDEMLPNWVRDLVDTQVSGNQLQQAIDEAAIEWAAPTGQVPTEETTTTAG